LLVLELKTPLISDTTSPTTFSIPLNKPPEDLFPELLVAFELLVMFDPPLLEFEDELSLVVSF